MSVPFAEVASSRRGATGETFGRTAAREALGRPTPGGAAPRGEGPGRFGAVVTAMVTPFDGDGGLDLDGAVTLAHRLVENATCSLVLAGTTGEGPTLSDDEKIRLWRTVAAEVDVPVIANAGTNDTRRSVALVRAATDAGVAGILAVTPYYNRPSQAGIEAHFGALASATPLPMLVYDIPVRTGRRVDQDVMLRLIERHGNLAGVKDATGDVAGAARLAARLPRAFDVYSGDDALTLAFLAVGGAGVISVAAHWAGPELLALCEAFFGGRVDEARGVNALLADSYAFESTEDAPNPVPTKAMLRVMGLPAGACRLPMGPTPPEVERRAAALLGALVRGRSASVSHPEAVADPEQAESARG